MVVSVVSDGCMQYETGSSDHCAAPTELTGQHSTVLLLVIPQRKLTDISALTRKYPVQCTETLS